MSEGVVVLNQVPIELFDADGNKVIIIKDGPNQIGTRDELVASLLEDMLDQLKIINLYFLKITELELTTGDTE